MKPHFLKSHFFARTACYFLLFVLFAFFFAAACTAQPSEVLEVPADAFIGNYSGINLDADALHFGTLGEGKEGSRTRVIVIANNGEQIKKITLSVTGTIAQGITFSDASFLLEPHQNKTVQVTFTLLSDMEYGNYTGIVHIVSKSTSS